MMITNLYQLTVRQVEELFTEASTMRSYNHNFRIHKKVIKQILKYSRGFKIGTQVYRYPDCTIIDDAFFKD